MQGKTEEIEKYKFIPIDTKHLSREVKFELLSSFENLEELLNGELIKSDNFQALNTIMPKYQGKIDLIYIDPPFNTGSDFEYKDKFQDSTWLSLMENRLELAKNLLSDKGSFYLHLDHNANYRGRELLNSIFGEENFRNEIVWHYGTYVGQTSKNFPRKHDNIMFYSKNEQSIFFMQRDNLLENDANYKRWKKYFNKNNQIVGNNYPKDDSKFDGYVNRFINENGREPIDEKDILLDIDGKLVDTVWEIQSINPMSLERLQGEITQKPEALLQRIIKASSDENSIILDFFAGSGTTCAVALKLGRKFLGVEMGEHFYKVIIPRLKKVIAGFQSGISKETEYKGGGAFRYYELESYEEALANCEYVLKIGNDKKINSIPYDINDYYNENIDFYEGIIDYRKSRKLIKKLNKAENKPITINMSAEYREEFDIFQTIANIMNLKIKRLFLDKNGVESCEYDNGEILNIENVDLYKYPKLKSLIWWRE